MILIKKVIIQLLMKKEEKNNGDKYNFSNIRNNTYYINSFVNDIINHLFSVKE